MERDCAPAQVGGGHSEWNVSMAIEGNSVVVGKYGWRAAPKPSQREKIEARRERRNECSGA
jgi:hypothetical protein